MARTADGAVDVSTDHDGRTTEQEDEMVDVSTDQDHRTTEQDDEMIAASSTVGSEESTVDPGAVTVDGDPATVRPDQRGSGTRFLSSRFSIALLVLLLVAAGVFVGRQAVDWREREAREHDRADGTEAAQVVARAIATTSATTIDEDLQEVLALATGEFATTVRANLETQTELVKQFEVTSDAKIEETGVVDQADGQVTVAIALTSTIKNSENTTGRQQLYRMVIEMQKQNDDSWLASSVEFVQ